MGSAFSRPQPRPWGRRPGSGPIQRTTEKHVCVCVCRGGVGEEVSLLDHYSCPTVAQHLRGKREPSDSGIL